MRNNSDSFSLFLNFVRVKYDRGVVLKYIGVDDYKKSFFLDFDVVYAVRVKFKNKLDLSTCLHKYGYNLIYNICRSHISNPNQSTESDSVLFSLLPSD